MIFCVRYSSFESVTTAIVLRQELKGILQVFLTDLKMGGDYSEIFHV
jgi:hypothetical protein